MKNLLKEYDYPEEYWKIIRLGLTNIEPWLFYTDEKLRYMIYEGMISRYNRPLVPFAYRMDNDDVVCFEVGKGSKVQIIHNFASLGWEQREVYEDFSEWFKMAIDEMLISDY